MTYAEITFTFDNTQYKTIERTNWYTFTRNSKDFWCKSLKDEVNTKDNWLVGEEETFESRVYGYTEIKNGAIYHKVDF